MTDTNSPDSGNSPLSPEQITSASDLSTPVRNDFYDRVDEYIHIANQQCNQADKGKVSASLLFAAARFNSWVSASGFASRELMQANRQELVQYFVQQYQSMLEDNLDEFIANFSSYQKDK